MTDDLKWFGEGFDGFPKHLPEDSIEYAVYVLNTDFDIKTNTRQRLKEVEQEASRLSTSLLGDYIWQRDSFALALKYDKNNAYLYGKTSFGDSVADEWTIVFLLRQISVKFPDTWIRLQDNDGEFLLVEAANVLPTWLNPEVATNRVWINEGKVKIIPIRSPSGSAETTKGPLNFTDAKEYVAAHSSKLIHQPAIDQEAFHRIKNYPDGISNNFHHAVVRISRKLAYIIHQLPQSISQATEAFYLRDSVSLKHLQNPKKGRLIFHPHDLVTVSMKFTKVGYAQIKGQEFEAPFKWPFPTGTNISLSESKQHEVGMKLTCGFEMLVSDRQFQDFKSVREIRLILEDLENGDESLPSDKDIESWSQQQDDEIWLDIDYNTLDQMLSGKASKSNDPDGGFGDKVAQETLSKMVERFENFVKGNEMGIEGDELDDMDDDDDDDDTTDRNEDDGDVEAELDIDRNGSKNFPPKEDLETLCEFAEILQRSNIKEVTSEEEDIDSPENGNFGDGEDVNAEMQQIEDELRDLGVLDLADPASISSIQQASERPRIGNGGEDISSDKASNHRAELATYMLESFKAQGGTPGPAGNILEMIAASSSSKHETVSNESGSES